MRFVFICDEYPPLEGGGYAQLCYDLAHSLRERGHQVTILCERANKPIQDTEPVVRALLAPVRYDDRLPIPLQQIVFAKRRREYNLQVFKRILTEAQPEAVLFWPTYYVDTYLMLEAERIPGLTVAYYIAGFSPTQPSLLAEYWSHPGRSLQARLVKSFLRPFLARDAQETVPLSMRHVMCVSEYERQRVIREGVLPENAIVVHNGIDLAQFPFLGLPSTRRKFDAPLRVLYAGRLVQTKGAHTIIEALRLIRSTNPQMTIYLTLLGKGQDEYIWDLHQRIAQYGLSDWVNFREWLDRSQVPAFMSAFDILVLPTIHPEPLARVVQEAMAMGLVVVATPTGGTPEIVHDGMTGLAFAPENAVELADCLQRLYSDLTLCDRLAIAAYTLVKDKFTIQAMSSAVEGHFATWIRGSVQSIR